MSRIFIVAGGPSVAGQDTDRLKGSPVIAINSSWRRVPFAAILFFADDRWWREYEVEVLAEFKGRIVTCAHQVHHSRMERLKRRTEFGLSSDAGEVMVRRTSLTGALNLAMHMGFRNIVLLGADGGPAADGRIHHHAEYSPRLATSLSNLWHEQRADLDAAAQSLKQRAIDVVNASPGSALPFWPEMTLDEALRETSEA